ncbi:GNAT family N-acetyltransferase [Shewanella frigidimarina]|jgi:GNAT superfamily N-acetyltransferase|uniref:GNAT family N-acetyltransferase n=1 Tax=Shewanella frigidimarina TaxID=56812 RepID=UPI003D78F84B|tara:strand:+ start:2087 stop:2581 length:495 start_codon:yes stop_codon:yes gene_type:complete
MSIRPITTTDWPAIMAIQAQCYVELTPESLGVMQSKWQASPTSCVVFEQQDNVLAYALVHPWLQGDAPSLDTEISGQINADSWYLHDMAISPSAQGMGIGKKLFNHIVNQAKNLAINGIGLVAVQGAHTYWLQQGFKPNTTSVKLTKSLDSYPAGACYLYLSLS